MMNLLTIKYSPSLMVDNNFLKALEREFKGLTVEIEPDESFMVLYYNSIVIQGGISQTYKADVLENINQLVNELEIEAQRQEERLYNFKKSYLFKGVFEIEEQIIKEDDDRALY